MSLGSAARRSPRPRLEINAEADGGRRGTPLRTLGPPRAGASKLSSEAWWRSSLALFDGPDDAIVRDHVHTKLTEIDHD